MKKVNMLKKLLSFGLAVALFVTSPASVYALDAEGTSVVSMADENVEEEKVATPEPISGEEKSDSDIQLEDEGKSVPSEDPTDDELNTDSPRAGIADEDFAKEDEATKDDVEKAEEEATCEHSEFRYESNGDGTHKKICKDCDEVVAEKEPCEFDENGKCVLCGYEDPEHKFTLTDENGIVKVTGTKAVLNGATRVVATEITADEHKTELDKMADALDEEVAKESKSVVDFVAYDITLCDDNNKEVTIQGNVNVVFTQLEVEGITDSEKTTEVYHYAEKTETVEQMTAKQISDDTVEMVTSHFSKYILVTTDNSSSAIVKNNKYVKVESVNNGNTPATKFQDSTTTSSNNGRLLEINVYVDGKFVERCPANNNYFKTNSNDDKRANLKITPTSDYVLDYVTGNEICTKLNGNAFDDSSIVEGKGENDKYVGNEKISTAVLKDDTVRIGLGKNDSRKGFWATKVNIYLKEETTRNIKVDLFDYANASDGFSKYWLSRSGINYMSSKNAKDKGLYMKNDTSIPGPNLIFNTSSVDDVAWGADEASAWHEGDSYSGICDDKLTKTRGGKITFSRHGVVNLFDADKAENRTGNRSIDRDDNGDIYKWGYYDVDFPFTKTDDGYWQYDCNENSALFNESKNAIVLGEVANKNDKVYSNMFWPLNSVNTVSGNNIHFGMHFTQYFKIPKGGKNGSNDCIFKFSGDDDVWVFIDGEKVLDIGGIHGEVTGDINFASGISRIYKEDQNNHNISGIIQQQIGLDKFADGKFHEIQFFYLERGAQQSKCKIKFNFDIPEETNEKTNVSFIKQDTNGQPISGVKFELRDSNNNKVNEATSVTNGTVPKGTVTFNEVSTGTYYLVETSPAAGYTAPNHRWVVNVVKFEDKFTYDIYAEDDSEDCQLVEDKFVIINEKDRFEKTLTIEKEWVGDKAENRPEEVTFKVHATYKKDANTVQNVARDGSKIIDTPEYFEVKLTKADADKDNTNLWKKTIEKLPIFVGNDTKEVITWVVEEADVTNSGYTVQYLETEFDKDSSYMTNDETLPEAVSKPSDNKKYNHIDVELWAAAEDGETTNSKIVGIQDYDGNEDHITVIGYYDGQWQAKNKSVKVQKDENNNEYGTRHGFMNQQADSVSVSNDTKIAFRIKFEGWKDYKLVVLDNKSTYDEGTTIRKPDKDAGNFKNICDYLNKYNVNEVPLDNQNIYTIAKEACPGGNNDKGIDLVLTPKTVKKYVVTDGTGNETHKIKNIKSELIVDKTVEVGDYNKRIYKLNLSADYNGTQVITHEGEAAKNADVAIVIDASGSMISTDAAIISASSNAETVSLLGNLDTNKIYFTGTKSIDNDYGTGYKIDAEAAKRLNDGAKQDGKYYGLPSDGYFIFYKNGKWYRKPVIYNREYKLGKKDWDSIDSNTKEVNTQNCEFKTVYTNRSEVVIRACNDMISKLTPNSRVAVISFTGNSSDSKTQCNLLTIKDNMSTIQTAVSNCYGTKDAGTASYYGLNLAYNILKADSQNAKYLVFFTDGNDTGEAYNPAPSIDSITELIHKKVTGAYAIGVGTNGTTIGKVASDKNHEISASSIAEVAQKISSIGTEITTELKPKTGKGTVTDVIDSRFILTDENGNAIKVGKSVGTNGTLEVDENGVQKVVWREVEIGTGDKAWSASIYVKARDEFFGGNKVKTNGVSSGVSIDGDMTVSFPHPTVNVKLLDYSLTGNSVTLWQGDIISTPAYVNELIDGIKIPDVPGKATLTDVVDSAKLSEEEIETLKSGVAVEKDYTASNETLGKFKYILTLKDKDNVAVENKEHTAEVVGNAVETYVLTIEYTPVSVEDRNKIDTIKNLPTPVGTEVTAVTPANPGTYTVNVITGALDVTKKSKTEDGTALGGATYKLQKKADNKWSDVATLTSSSDTATLGKMHLDNLGVGEYRLTETSAPSAYALSNDEFIINVARNEQETTKVLYNVTVTKNGTVVETWSVDPTANAIEDKVENPYKCELADSVVTTSFNAVDQILYTLPETGGRGVYVYTIGGVLLMLGACLLLYKNKKNKNK